MRILFRPLFWFWDSDLPHHFDSVVPRLGVSFPGTPPRNEISQETLFKPINLFARKATMCPDRLGDLLSNSEDRVERFHWILKDHSNIVATDLLEPFL
jgi:hypothetical protein